MILTTVACCLGSQRRDLIINKTQVQIVKKKCKYGIESLASASDHSFHTEHSTSSSNHISPSPFTVYANEPSVGVDAVGQGAVLQPEPDPDGEREATESLVSDDRFGRHTVHHLQEPRRGSFDGLKAHSHRHARHDTVWTVLSCLAGGVNWALPAATFTIPKTAQDGDIVTIED